MGMSLSSIEYGNVTSGPFAVRMTVGSSSLEPVSDVFHPGLCKELGGFVGLGEAGAQPTDRTLARKAL
jgi:hypothetical protein